MQKNNVLVSMNKPKNVQYTYTHFLYSPKWTPSLRRNEGFRRRGGGGAAEGGAEPGVSAGEGRRVSAHLDRPHERPVCDVTKGQDKDVETMTIQKI